MRPRYPTFLYYNPFSTPQEVDLDAGTEAKDVYDAVSKTFPVRNARSKTRLMIPADTARVIVLAPAGGVVTHAGKQTLIGGVVVDYQN